MLPIWLRSWPGPNASFGREVFEKARFSPALRPLKDDVVGSIGRVLWLVMGAVGLILLIACANVANLLLVKAESRQHERGIRMALGAGRAQILRESLAESLLLGAAGGLLGLAFAYGGLRLLRFMEPGNLPRLDEISIDASVMLFALAASLFSCLLFGLLPALKYAGSQLAPALRMGGRSAGTSRERHRAQNVLLVGQVSLALVLLVTSGLMLRTFQEIRKVRPGFTSPEQVQVFGLAIPRSQVEQPERVVRMWNDILERLAAIPGVSAAGLANSLPMDDTKNQNPIIAENTRSRTRAEPAGPNLQICVARIPGSHRNPPDRWTRPRLGRYLRPPLGCPGFRKPRQGTLGLFHGRGWQTDSRDEQQDPVARGRRRRRERAR